MSTLPPALDKYMTVSAINKIMALIYGQPITGKTTGARTFPNCIIVDFDGNLPPDVPNVIPMWSDTFVDGIKPRAMTAPGLPPMPANRRDVLLTILADLSKSLPKGYTIIVDSLTRIESWYNAQEEAEPKPRGKSGDVDGHTLFRKRLAYFDTLFSMLTACPANVIFIAHQQQDRDDKGNITMQVKPALQGQIGEKMPGYFPIVLQARREVDTKNTANINYVWRVRPTHFETARVPKPVSVDTIPQNYNELIKYC